MHGCAVKPAQIRGHDDRLSQPRRTRSQQIGDIDAPPNDRQPEVALV
jgi:hypothetical protein